MTRSLEAAARRIGHYCWIEMRVFQTLGAWSGSVPEPEVAATLAIHSRQHGWHAELWHDLLPVIGETGVDHYVEAPNPGVVAFADALAQPAAEQTIEKLVGAYRVLVPREVAAYRAHLRVTSPLSDGPTMRVLELVLADQERHWREGEGLLQRQLRSGAEVQRAASHQARLEALLVHAGGIVGTGRPTAWRELPG